jgi:osmoprotectant transport system permease protein
LTLQYLFDHWPRVLALAAEHLQLTLVAVLVALAIAVPLSALVVRYASLNLPVFGLLGAMYTVPSLALLAMLVPILGLGRVPAVVALAAYALIFLTRNMVAGLRGVDPVLMEAARGVGMNGRQIFWDVRLPLALPVILAGVRIALVTTVSLATLMAWINAGGLGLLLFDGITRDNPSMILAGAVAVSTLAILADQGMRRVEGMTVAARARRAATRR